MKNYVNFDINGEEKLIGGYTDLEKRFSDTFASLREREFVWFLSGNSAFSLVCKCNLFSGISLLGN